MPRQRRCIANGQPHHLVQRGSNRQDVFLDDDDRRFYLGVLAEVARSRGVRLVAYCLMTNHVHLVVTPPDTTSLAHTIAQAHSRHTQRFNRRHGRVGHLWHSRYYADRLDIGHLCNAVRYIERNPVRSGMVDIAEDHPWSSASAHCGLDANDGAMIDPVALRAWRRRFPPHVWRQLLLQPEDPRAIAELRAGVFDGRSLIDGDNLNALLALYDHAHR